MDRQQIINEHTRVAHAVPTGTLRVLGHAKIVAKGDGLSVVTEQNYAYKDAIKAMRSGGLHFNAAGDSVGGDSGTSANGHGLGGFHGIGQ